MFVVWDIVPSLEEHSMRVLPMIVVCDDGHGSPTKLHILSKFESLPPRQAAFDPDIPIFFLNPLLRGPERSHGGADNKCLKQFPEVILDHRLTRSGAHPSYRQDAGASDRAPTIPPGLDRRRACRP